MIESGPPADALANWFDGLFDAAGRSPTNSTTVYTRLGADARRDRG